MKNCAKNTIGIMLISLMSTFASSQIEAKDSIRPSLIELCEKYKTDKCAAGHNFIEIYEDLFEQYRDVMGSFFEIGILNGSSHLMWREYFPNSKIFGIDIMDYSEKSKNSGIQTFVADQSNREDLHNALNYFKSTFDVILDDGGHAMDHQQISLAYLFKQLNKGGYYIIEDIHTSLPKYYPDTAFKVNEDQTNTTLFMLEQYMRTGKINSDYMTSEEVEFLEQNIESVEIRFRNTRHHSMMCIIRKKY